MEQRLGDKKLGADDARAVDLLLDQATRTEPMYAVPGHDGFEMRVHSVESILKLLNDMPAEDPPADLAERTMRRIEQREYQPSGSQVQLPAAQVQPRHHA